ncbi:hypothetical protein [Flavobacterium sp. JP2137]|uniref:hypothetical protein n=1 Tax=Flavobacterium sp. JP2137 TaxID=3414510 RepID=UPI003D2FD65D
MKTTPLSILIFGLLVLVLGYILKATALLHNHFISIVGLIFIAVALATLVVQRLKK